MAAPLGNRNAAKAKQWAAAIERALDKRGAGDRLKALNELAEKFLACCDLGDLQALRELGDRLDGKSHQSAELNVEHTGSIEHRGLPEIGGRVEDLLAGRAGSDSPALLPH